MEILKSVRRTGMAAVIFLAAYFFGTVLFSKDARNLFIRQFIERPRHVPASEAVQPGQVISIPRLASLSGGNRMVPKGERIVVTSFAGSCSVVQQSGSFWNKLSSTLERSGAAYMMIGCAPSPEDLARVVRSANLRADVVFGGSCDGVGEPFRLNGGIRTYVLDHRSVVVDAWAGAPLRADGEAIMIQGVLTAVLGSEGPK